MVKRYKERECVFHPDFLLEWQKYEKAYGPKAAEKFTAWIDKNGLDVEFPLQPQIEARLHIPSAQTRPQAQYEPNISPQKIIQGQVFGNPLFIGRIPDQRSVEKDDFSGYSGYKIIDQLDGRKYFEEVAQGWMNIELGPRPQITGKKNKR